MTTGWVFDERCMWHDAGSAGAWIRARGPVEPEPHGESPATKRRFRNLVEVSGLLDRLVSLRAREATREELLRLHTPEYVDRIKALSDADGGDAGIDTPFGPGSFEIASLAVGGCLAAVDAVLDGRVDNAYALVRPPGHHAEEALGRGACLFANVALAALHARARGLERIATVDWDVHHGNGAQRAFYADPSVLTISLHHSAMSPDPGTIAETGQGAGVGFNVNVPLPPGSGVGAYVAALERVVLPALEAFGPELILVSSGFDASAIDPFGRMLLHSDGYRRLTRLLLDASARLCHGRLVLCHEGGYSTAYVPFCGLAVVEELAGERTGVEDPFLPSMTKTDDQLLQPHQDAAVAAALDAAPLLRGVTT
jgi:acetoin utilization deacetylase AcuC-like enzyme